MATPNHPATPHPQAPHLRMGIPEQWAADPQRAESPFPPITNEQVEIVYRVGARISHIEGLKLAVAAGAIGFAAIIKQLTSTTDPMAVPTIPPAPAPR